MKTKEILEKIKNFLVKYNTLFVIPVVLITILSIWLIKDLHIKLYLFIITCVLIVIQFIGARLQYKKMKHDNLQKNLQIIKEYKETIQYIKHSVVYSEEEKVDMIDSCNQIIDILTPNKSKFKTKITRLFKRI